MKLMLAGDVNLKQDLGFQAVKAFEPVEEEFAAADVRLANLEGCFSDPGPELFYKPFWHHVEPAAASALAGRFDAVSCANNVHYGQAILDSLAVLDDLGIGHAGAGADVEAARRAAVVETGGRKLGLLAYTSVFWPTGARATLDSAGVATLQAYTAYQPNRRIHDMPGGPAVVRTWPDAGELEAALEEVRELRSRVDHVVVYVHWGYTHESTPAEYQRTVGRALIDAGAQVVAGASPHVPQGVERHGRGVILHSLGNFIFGAAHHREFSRTGLLARVDLDDGGGLAGLTVVPVVRGAAQQVQPLDAEDGGEGRAIAELVVSASAALGTEAVIADGAVRVPIGRA
jgi:poly-gamma-glutamate capsule biosynthesis protein CapA/YwtB (metallophosphatase superfamily)